VIRRLTILLRRSPVWRHGLVHLHCSECQRDLAWAPPEFADRHPAPLCWPCRLAVCAGQIDRAAIVIPSIESSARRVQV